MRTYQARLRAFSPKALLGPAFMPGRGDVFSFLLVVFGGPFTGLLDVRALAKSPRNASSHNIPLRTGSLRPNRKAQAKNSEKPRNEKPRKRG